MESIELFSARVCPFAHRSRLALMEKNLPFTLIEIDLRNKPDWYSQINPAGAVPVLRQGDFVLRESLIVNEYVNECCAEPALLPASAQQRAKARLWIDYAGTSFVPLFYRLLKAQQTEEQSVIATELCGALAVLDEELKRCQGEGPYWFGWSVGLADITFYPWLERWPVLEHYRGLRIPEHLTSLLGWIDAMQGRDAVRLGSEPTAYYIDQYADYAAGRR